MVTVGFNPSTLKVKYKPDTKKVCIGCCGDNTGVPCSASACSGKTTPKNLYVTLSNLSLCSDCYRTGGAYGSASITFSADINGEYVLSQNAMAPCFWYGIFQISSLCRVQIFPYSNNCTGFKSEDVTTEQLLISATLTGGVLSVDISLYEPHYMASGYIFQGFATVSDCVEATVSNGLTTCGPTVLGVNGTLVVSSNND